MKSRTVNRLKNEIVINRKLFTHFLSLQNVPLKGDLSSI